MLAPEPLISTQEGPQAAPLTRLQRLAVLLVVLGSDSAAQILRGLDPQEVESISTEMAKFTMVPRELQTEVLRDFSEVALQAGTAIRGGLDLTRVTLEKALGLYKATEVLARVAPAHSPVPAVAQIAEMEASQIYSLIRHEQPQTIALVLSHASPEKAAQSLSLFPLDQRDKILERIATLAPSPIEVVEKVFAVLVSKRMGGQTRAVSQTGGIKNAADLLKAMEKNQSKTLLGSIEERSPELGQAIRQKMFTFEDLTRLDTPALQRILREVDMRELAVALKNASDDLKARLLSCITKRAAESVEEEMSLMGSVRPREIQAAQLRLIEAVRNLEAEGAIELNEGSETAV